MIKIALLVSNPFQENTFVVTDCTTNECVVIDAGNYSASEDEKLKAYIEQNNLKVAAMINTHAHVDHILGVEFGKRTFNAPFALHCDDYQLLENAQSHGAMYGFEIKSIPSVDIDLSKIDTYTFGETTLNILHIPGHSPGHIALFEPTSKSLFCGDTVFKESIGRTDLPGGDYATIMDSIIKKILPLGDEVSIYPGHGPKSTIGHEALYNPFITDVVNGDIKY